ncbi:gfo/Idh/MocA family oxidoreductase [Deinococcus cavernae]|uniref:Gfo/Idh/MocA family oxidoreductase n=1 Tax=Deinococcus cavernae TaxID=2320857 RepID=A0A418VAH1_9DEIO|nr:Gfo/Idh/MocA family oxidoreductase [Deinococcus cavernae]RJF73067.1 gfo/Idh/MocA family oxidoreductase [Deinococcus cavernae]
MTRVKIALLGAAHVHAPGYAAWLQAQPDVEFIGFSEDNPQYARDFAAAPHLPLAQLLALNPHGVIICSENAKHRALTEAAAQAGAHILCEKPISTTLEDAQAMRRACQHSGVSLHVAYPLRYSPAVQELRQLISMGDLGEILAYSGINHSICPDRDRAWFSDPALAGGGAGMDHIVHLADLLFSFGERVDSVYAQLRPVPELVLPEHAGVDAVGLVTLRLASGAGATIDCSWSRPRSYPRWGHLKLDVIGTRGLQSLDAFAESINVTTPGGHHWAGYGPDLNAAMLRDFIHACQGQAAPLLADAEAGEETLKIVLAAYASSECNAPVSLS